MALRLFQANLNHDREAQDLFLHCLAERSYGLEVAAEPYRVPSGNAKWASDRAKYVAVVWSGGGVTAPSPFIRKFEDGRRFGVVGWGTITIIAVYLSPRCELRRVEQSL